MVEQEIHSAKMDALLARVTLDSVQLLDKIGKSQDSLARGKNRDMKFSMVANYTSDGYCHFIYSSFQVDCPKIVTRVCSKFSIQNPCKVFNSKSLPIRHDFWTTNLKTAAESVMWSNSRYQGS